MSPRSFVLLAASLTLAACGGDSATTTEAAAPEPAPTAESAPAVAPPSGDLAEVTLQPSGELMEYAQTSFVVAPGQTVRLTFENTATGEAMHHNVVVLEQGADANAFGQAAMSAADTDYIPADLEAQVLAHTPMSAPGETVTVEFTAPSEPGDYTYLCTFPGHYMTMKGTMTVAAAS